MQTSNWASLAVSFGLVLAMMGAFLWLLRRMQARGIPGTSQRRIRILEVASVGPRQKLILLSVREQEILIGLSAQQMTTLANFPAAAGEGSPMAQEATAGGSSLASLSSRMSERLKRAANADVNKRNES